MKTTWKRTDSGYSKTIGSHTVVINTDYHSILGCCFAVYDRMTGKIVDQGERIDIADIKVAAFEALTKHAGHFLGPIADVFAYNRAKVKSARVTADGIYVVYGRAFGLRIVCRYNPVDDTYDCLFNNGKALDWITDCYDVSDNL